VPWVGGGRRGLGAPPRHARAAHRCSLTPHSGTILLASIRFLAVIMEHSRHSCSSGMQGAPACKAVGQTAGDSCAVAFPCSHPAAAVQDASACAARGQSPGGLQAGGRAQAAQQPRRGEGERDRAPAAQRPQRALSTHSLSLLYLPQHAGQVSSSY
jgi:hypothetical protein